MSGHVIGWDPESERPDAWLVDLTCDCGHRTQRTVTEPRVDVPLCEGCGKRRAMTWRIREVFVGPMQKVPGGLIA